MTSKTDRYERSFLVTKDSDNYKIVKYQDFVYNPMNLRFGALAASHVRTEISVSAYYNVFEIQDKETIGFWEEYLVTQKMLNYYYSIATGSLIEKLRVYYSSFVEIKKPLPDNEEMGKISQFLQLFNELISLQHKKLEFLKKYKRGLVSSILSQKNKTQRKDSWVEYPLNEILHEYNEKSSKTGLYEHVSLTKEGVIPKTERYNRDFLVTQDDKQYRITHYNDICYNPANLKFGVICRNKYKDAIFSPIYVTFKVKNGFLPEFIELIVTNQEFIQKALRFQQGTVYERMAVNPEDLLKIKVSVPDYNTQTRLASLINKIELSIEKEEYKLSELKKYKNGLLQQMFI